MRDCTLTSTATVGSSLSCEEELVKYMALQVPTSSSSSNSCNPLAFWRDNTKKYPIIRPTFVYFRKFFTVRDRLLSVGHTITDVWSRLQGGVYWADALGRASRLAAAPVLHPGNWLIRESDSLIGWVWHIGIPGMAQCLSIREWRPTID